MLRMYVDYGIPQPRRRRARTPMPWPRGDPPQNQRLGWTSLLCPQNPTRPPRSRHAGLWPSEALRASPPRASQPARARYSALPFEPRDRRMTRLAEEIAREYGTPAVVIDLDRVERNIARLQAACDAAGVANRPHIKTHKSPVIAQMQRDAGARGITCQKIGEAEVMAQAGLDDILISYNLLGEDKMARLAKVMERASVTVAADNPTVVAGLPRAAELSGRTLNVVVECDTGRKRAGVETPAEAIALAKDIASRPGLSFAGFMLYPPEDAMRETQAFFDEAAAGVREAGLEPRIVSTGGTPNVVNLGKIAGATEHRAGT